MRIPQGPVALISPRYTPAIGGVERHVEMLAQGLNRAGVQVEVITTDPTGRLPEQEERDGVLVRRFPTLANDGIYFLSPWLGRWLQQHAGRFALLHAHSYHTPLALQALLAARRHTRPLVLTPHYHGTGHSLIRQAMHVPYRLCGRWLIRNAQLVICVSSTEQILLRGHFGESFCSTVIPNGVEAEPLLNVHPHEKPAGQITVLSVGRLEPYKQPDRLVAALRLLPNEYRATIIGDGSARARIQRLVRKWKLEERVLLPGHISHGELRAWYRTAAVFVSMSRHEAFGITLLEAAIAGTAVVASDIPAHREVASYLPDERASFVSPDCSATELAEAVIRAAGHSGTVPVPGQLPTWNEMVQKTLESYQLLLDMWCCRMHTGTGVIET